MGAAAAVAPGTCDAGPCVTAVSLAAEAGAFDACPGTSASPTPETFAAACPHLWTFFIFLFFLSFISRHLSSFLSHLFSWLPILSLFSDHIST